LAAVVENTLLKILVGMNPLFSISYASFTIPSFTIISTLETPDSLLGSLVTKKDKCCFGLLLSSAASSFLISKPGSLLTKVHKISQLH